MDLLDQGRISMGEVTVPAVHGSDEMITQESIARGEARGRYRGLSISIEGNGRQSGRDGSKILIGEVLERDRARRDDTGRPCVRYGGGEGERLAPNDRRKIRHAGC